MRSIVLVLQWQNLCCCASNSARVTSPGQHKVWDLSLCLALACFTRNQLFKELATLCYGMQATSIKHISLSQVLSGLVAGVVSLTALKAGAVDLQDERQVRQRGFDLIYEARDLDLDQSTRDGLTQYRKNIDSTKTRVKEAERIIDTKLDNLVKKKYW